MNPIILFLVTACALVGLDLFLAPPFLVAAVIIALSLKMANAGRSSSSYGPVSASVRPTFGEQVSSSSPGPTSSSSSSTWRSVGFTSDGSQRDIVVRGFRGDLGNPLIVHSLSRRRDCTSYISVVITRRNPTFGKAVSGTASLGRRGDSRSRRLFARVITAWPAALGSVD